MPGVNPVNNPVALVTGATTGVIPVTVYEIPEPLAGAVTFIVPVETIQVGCFVTLAVGAAGAPVTTLMVKGVAVDTHSALVVVTAYTPGANPVNNPVALVTGATTGVIPVTVYEIPEPLAGAVTVIVPVETIQVGCVVTLAVGAAGAAHAHELVTTCLLYTSPSPR